MEAKATATQREPWNKGKIVGQKAPFKLKDIWALRVRLQMQDRVRELALFDLGIDSKLRGCDLVRLKVRDICHGDLVASRAIVTQQKRSLYKAWLMARAPVTLRFIGHSTWMSRNGSTPNLRGSRVFTRSTTVCAISSGSSTGSM